MRRDAAKARDYAERHGVPRWYVRAEDLIADDAVDAVYVATPPSTHCDLSLRVAAARKPCLVEKPMALNHGECVRMVDAFDRAEVPLWVAYYRRALPRFVATKEFLRNGLVGRVTSVHVEVMAPLLAGRDARIWRVDPAIAGAGLLFDLGSHAFDLLDFLIGPIAGIDAVAVNTGGTYAAEDVTTAAFEFSTGAAGSAVFNFNASGKGDAITIRGSAAVIETTIFGDTDVIVRTAASTDVHEIRNPPHVHQPLIQTIVDELHGRGLCPSTGESAARTSWVLDQCVHDYYRIGRAGS
jgi:1,5-anhydro-D-fructose reductase (1,5-anhydro-D-mannitol-forming)